MRLNPEFILFFLIFSSKIGSATLIDTSYSYQPIMFSHSFKPSKEISKSRIKSRLEFLYLDSVTKSALINVETINYDRKGRISKIIHFGDNIDDTISYTISYKWLSDTSIDVKIFYNKDFEKGKKADIYGKDGSWKRAVIVSKADSGKNYFTRVRIILNKNFEVNTISYLDWEGQVYEVFFPFKSEWGDALNQINKLDTIKDGDKIKSITSIYKRPKQLINGRESEEYNSRNESVYYYDSLNRVKEICNIGTVNNVSNSSMSIITYYDSTRIKTIQRIYFGENYISNRKEFFYNEKGSLIRVTLVKDESDSVINDEYIYIGDTTIYNYRFKRNKFSKTGANVILWQYKSARGLELERLFYVDNKLDNYRKIFKYKKRSFLRI